MTALPERPVDPDWLALREPADTQARAAAVDQVVAPLLDHLANEKHLHVVDLGAGTGANLRWLSPHLDRIQRWTLVDHDPRLVSWGPVESTTVRADVADLGVVIADVGRPHLITAAALLDLLTPKQVGAVVDAVLEARTPALFALTVTGEATIDPPHPRDAPMKAAFDSHQRRGERLGPDAAPETAERFRQVGWRVVEVSTPWRLDTTRPDLLDAWLDGRAEAAVEWDPDLRGPAADWLAARGRQIEDGALTATVGHTDVLALPPMPPTRT